MLYKPEKFDDFIEAILTEARQESLLETCNYYCGIKEDELEECLNWLNKLQEVEEVWS